MSEMGQYRIKLQEMPEYEQGWNAYERGVSNNNAYVGDAKKAFDLGYHDAHYDRQIFGDQ